MVGGGVCAYGVNVVIMWLGSSGGGDDGGNNGDEDDDGGGE